VASFLSFARGLGLLIARVVLGGILVAHGWDRWQVRGIDSQVDYLNQFGVPYPLYATWGAIALELVGGLFLVVGLLTPLVAAAVAAQQVLIVVWTNWYRGPYLLSIEGRYVGGFEYNLALTALALLLLVFGGGGASVDRLFRRSKRRTEEFDDPAPAQPRAYGRTV
jgi:putative oxidoreductase